MPWQEWLVAVVVQLLAVGLSSAFVAWLVDEGAYATWGQRFLILLVIGMAFGLPAWRSGYRIGHEAGQAADAEEEEEDEIEEEP